MRAGVGTSAVIIAVSIASAIGLRAAASDTEVAGCAIRFYTGGPEIHANRTHECPHVTGVRVTASGDLVIDRNHTASIQSMTVSPDETLSTRGIIAGASGGASRTTIRFYDTHAGKRVRADDPVLQGPRANVWVTWVS